MILNMSILSRKTINNCKTNVNHYTNKGIVWELIKLKIRSTSIPYCINKKKKMYAFKHDLVKNMNLQQIELDTMIHPLETKKNS